MARDIHQAVREACLWFPESAETLSHGSPSFRVRGKAFASYMVNHHGDGRVALWLAAAPGAQEHYVSADPASFFVPPYVGVRGWLGVCLDKKVAWAQIAARVREAYEIIAPPALRLQLGKTPSIKAPALKPTAGDLDPWLSPRGRRLLQSVRRFCLRLPETREVVQFGHPVWQAGKKTYLWARAVERRLTLCFWVGVEQQNILMADERFRMPAYLGHNGWIALDVNDGFDAGEVGALTLQSYRHFALKRMVQRLVPDQGTAGAGSRAGRARGAVRGTRIR